MKKSRAQLRKENAAARAPSPSPAEVTERWLAMAFHGDLVGLECHLRSNFDVNQQDVHGKHALLCAAGGGHLATVQMLVRHGADVNRPEAQGKTAVYAAALNNQQQCLEELARNGADVNKADAAGRTPVCVAACRGHCQIIRSLHQLGADVNTPCLDGASPLFISAENAHLDVMHLLAKLGADINAADRNGYTPLAAATMLGYAEPIYELRFLGADAGISNTMGDTPLSIALTLGSSEAREKCIEALRASERCDADVANLIATGEYAAAKALFQTSECRIQAARHPELFDPLLLALQQHADSNAAAMIESELGEGPPDGSGAAASGAAGGANAGAGGIAPGVSSSRGKGKQRKQNQQRAMQPMEVCPPEVVRARPHASLSMDTGAADHPAQQEGQQHGGGAVFSPVGEGGGAPSVAPPLVQQEDSSSAEDAVSMAENPSPLDGGGLAVTQDATAAGSSDGLIAVDAQKPFAKASPAEPQDAAAQGGGSPLQGHMCSICMDNPVDSVLVHVREGTSHACTCMPCGQKLQQANALCPVCRAPVDHLVKLFFS